MENRPEPNRASRLIEASKVDETRGHIADSAAEMLVIGQVEDIVDTHAQLDQLGGFPRGGHIGGSKSRRGIGIVDSKRIAEAGIDARLPHDRPSPQGDGEGSLLEYRAISAIQRRRLRQRNRTVTVPCKVLGPDPRQTAK